MHVCTLLTPLLQHPYASSLFLPSFLFPALRGSFLMALSFNFDSFFTTKYSAIQGWVIQVLMIVGQPFPIHGGSSLVLLCCTLLRSHSRVWSACTNHFKARVTKCFFFSSGVARHTFILCTQNSGNQEVLKHHLKQQPLHFTPISPPLHSTDFGKVEVCVG